MCQQRKRFWLCLLFGWVLVILSGELSLVRSQERYPNAAIDIVCTFSAGGGSDLTARMLAFYLTKKWSQQINVVNKTGGNSIPGSLEVNRSTPDGYTVLQVGNANSSILAAVVKNLPFKVMERTFMGIYCITPTVLLVSASSPIKNLKDLEAEVKKNPESFTWGSLGGASSTDTCAKQFLRAIGVDVSKTKPVMSQGGSQAITLAAGGHIKFCAVSTSGALPAIKGGLLKALALTGKTRHPDFPDVPTTAEIGYPGIDSSQWWGISGPPKVPASVVGVWEKALEEAVKDSEFISNLRSVGALPYYYNAKGAREYVLQETEEMVKLLSSK